VHAAHGRFIFADYDALDAPDGLCGVREDRVHRVDGRDRGERVRGFDASSQQNLLA